jgi:hypothetical protein
MGKRLRSFLHTIDYNLASRLDGRLDEDVFDRKWRVVRVDDTVNHISIKGGVLIRIGDGVITPLNLEGAPPEHLLISKDLNDGGLSLLWIGWYDMEDDFQIAVDAM